MIEFKETLNKVKDINKVFCNNCGLEIEKDIYGYINDYLHIEKCWGYNSNNDGNIHNFDICEDCYIKLVENFKIPLEKNKK